MAHVLVDCALLLSLRRAGKVSMTRDVQSKQQQRRAVTQTHRHPARAALRASSGGLNGGCKQRRWGSSSWRSLSCVVVLGTVFAPGCGGEVRVGREFDSEEVGADERGSGGTGGSSREGEGDGGAEQYYVDTAGAAGDSASGDGLRCSLESKCGFDFEELCVGDCPAVVQEISLMDPLMGVELVPAPSGGVVLRTGIVESFQESLGSGSLRLFDTDARVKHTLTSGGIRNRGRTTVTSEGTMVSLTQGAEVDSFTLQVSTFPGMITTMFNAFLVSDFVALPSGGFLLSGEALGPSNLLGAELEGGPATLFVRQEWEEELRGWPLDVTPVYATLVGDFGGRITQFGEHVFLQEPEQNHAGDDLEFRVWHDGTLSPPIVVERVATERDSDERPRLSVPNLWIAEGEGGVPLLVLCEYADGADRSCLLSLRELRDDGTLGEMEFFGEMPVELWGVYGKIKDKRLVGYGHAQGVSSPGDSDCGIPALFELDFQSGDLIWAAPYPEQHGQLSYQFPIATDDEGRLVFMNSQELNSACHGQSSSWDGNHYSMQLTWLEL